MARTRSATSERLADAHVVDEREARGTLPYREGVGTAHHRAIEAIGKRLVGCSRVVEAVAHHHLACCQGGDDDLLHKLSARRLEEQKLACLAHRRVGRIEQKRTDLLRNLRAAGLAQAQHRAARMLKRRRKQARLRRLAAAVNALHGDKGGRAMDINRRHELSLPIAFVVSTYHTA